MPLPQLPYEVIGLIIDRMEEILTVEKMKPSLCLIQTAMSRRDGFNGQCQENTECEHWAFSAGFCERQFQAVNCRKCGNYDARYLRSDPQVRISCLCDPQEWN